MDLAITMMAKNTWVSAKKHMNVKAPLRLISTMY